MKRERVKERGGEERDVDRKKTKKRRKKEERWRPTDK
jgi:hypothetical protein